MIAPDPSLIDVSSPHDATVRRSDASTMAAPAEVAQACGGTTAACSTARATNPAGDSATSCDARIARCLDPHAMVALLAPLHAGAMIERVEIGEVQRSSSRHRDPHPLRAVYLVQWRGPVQGTVSRTRYLAKLFRHGASARAHQPGLTHHLPSLDMLLWPWPHDPGLPQLPALLDPACTLPHWGAPAAEVQVLHHRPETRATLRYLRDAAADAATALYVKTFADARGASLHQAFLHFAALSEREAYAPRVAEPLAYDPVQRALWQRAACGEPLRARLQAPADRGTLAVRVAAAWAVVHAAPRGLAIEAVRDRAHWRRELDRRVRKIGRAVPDLAARAARLGERLHHIATELPEPALTLIHGDCHHDQLWVDGEQVVMFDLDELALGDPMEDLAAFVVKLAPLPGGAEFATDLLAAYAQIAAPQFSLRRLHWHMALQQLLQAARAFRFQVPGWHGVLAHHLARAEAMLDHEAGPGVSA